MSVHCGLPPLSQQHLMSAHGLAHAMATLAMSIEQSVSRTQSTLRDDEDIAYEGYRSVTVSVYLFLVCLQSSAMSMSTHSTGSRDSQRSGPGVMQWCYVAWASNTILNTQMPEPVPLPGRSRPIHQHATHLYEKRLRVMLNSPSLWPTISSEMLTGR